MCRTAYLLRLLGLAAGLLLPSAVAAQCRLCAPTTGIAGTDDAGIPIEIEVESKLSFDQLVQVGQGTGSASVKPDGSKIITGSLGNFGGSGLVGNAVVRGSPGRLIRVDIPTTIELFSLSGAKAVVDEIETDLPSTPRLDSNGRLSFRFGGRLNVNGEGSGDYRGDLPITVEYL
ncbi:DUF4402 domain-containing protein [Sphingomonas piscis]|uniref:DUF4402 domain-containing protein n=1 Tax=Sphingomonas piscis TaxID=2714943 RepID=A0A6G7YPP8_9SPHN|nr:DUF4402 domain-containing protein [Sphingomonas piscis]QIK78714.1 DUF4402 domain-containing protein [Sphingomonas piscis]